MSVVATSVAAPKRETGRNRALAQLALAFGVFALLFVLVLLTAAKANGAAFLLNVATALVVLLLWCSASVAWAIDPSASLRREVFTTIVVLSVTYSTGMLRYQTVLSLL